MNKISAFILSAAMVLFSACGQKSGPVSICPLPVEQNIGSGTVALPETMGVYSKFQQLIDLAEVYEEGLAGKSDLPEVESVVKAGEAFLTLDYDKSLAEEEYSLNISDKGIRIKGGSDKGVWWGLQTLTQILLQNDNGVIPLMEIKDKPYFAYRGALLDCTRYFFPVEDVKTFIDMMSLHKLNTLHWHLTDDQGWRIEIKKYPLLAEKGSIRKETLVGKYPESAEYDGTPYGGYYSQEDIKEIVEYASKRQICIVPEIEMPGHALAALSCYPQLGCTGGPYEVRTRWGVSDNVFCMGKETTFDFLQNVLDEVCELFPGEMIHIGGDEAQTSKWENCPHCRKVIKDKGYTSARQLQSYLLSRIEPYLNAKGKKIIGWDEILEAGVTPTAYVMSWRGPEGGIEAAKKGNGVIMSPNNYMYYDYYYTSDPQKNEEPLAMEGHVSLKISYSFDPYEGLDEYERQYIKGIQANVWTEYIKDMKHLQHMVLPRFTALSEIAWAGRKEDYALFLNRVGKAMIPLYEHFDYNYATYAFEGIE